LSDQAVAIKFLAGTGILSIDPEKAALIHGRTGQHPGNNVPCTMCGGACVYIMLPKQRKYEKEEKKLQQAE